MRAQGRHKRTEPAKGSVLLNYRETMGSCASLPGSAGGQGGLLVGELGVWPGGLQRIGGLCGRSGVLRQSGGFGGGGRLGGRRLFGLLGQLGVHGGVVGAGEVAQGVDGAVLIAHLKVAVGAGGPPRGTHGGDGLALGDRLAYGDQQLGAVGVVGLEAVGVGEDDQVAIGSPFPGEDHRAVGGGVDGGALGSGDVDAPVEVVLPEDKPVAEVGGDGPRTGHR